MPDNELITRLIVEYGPWVILLVILWAERKRILDGLLSFLGQFWPSVQRRYERRAAVMDKKAEVLALERTDVIGALKETVQAYKHELEEAKHERVMLQNKFLEVISGQARREAQLIATLRDISDVLAHHSGRMERIETCLAALVERKGTDAPEVPKER